MNDASSRGRGVHRYFHFIAGCICMRILLQVSGPDFYTSREIAVMPFFNASKLHKLPSRTNTLVNVTHQTPMANNGTINPTLILHLGPPKTSSTHMQCILTNMADTLALDNYVFLGVQIDDCKAKTSTLGRVDGQQPSQRHCTDLFTGKYTSQFDTKFLQALRHSLEQGRNAIIVNECFMFFTPAQTQLLISEFSSTWNVKVILNYRRTYEYLPSYYNQGEKLKGEGRDRNPSLLLWPGERKGGIVGKPLLPFDIDNRGTFTLEFQDLEQQGLHPVEETRQKYADGFPDMSIIKLDDLDRTGSGDAVLQEMFCRILDMQHSCAAVKVDSTIQVANSFRNSYYSFNYDILATTAYTKKMFGFQNKNQTNKKKRRRVATDLIRHHQEDYLNLTHQDFPMSCLSPNKMNRILNASLTSEKVVFSRYGWSSTVQDEASHRQSFFAYQKQKPYYFCSINAEETLQDPGWRSFLASI